jgi:hypothetical protein
MDKLFTLLPKNGRQLHDIETLEWAQTEKESQAFSSFHLMMNTKIVAVNS